VPYLASASDDHAIIIWDARSGRPVRRWIGNVEQSGLTYSPDGSLLASSIGTDQGKLRFSVQLWDAERGTQTKLLAGHEADVCALAFDPSGNRLASGDRDGAVILWDVQSGRVLRREKEGSSPVVSVVFQDRGCHLLVGLDQGEISLFNLDRPEPPRRIVLPDGCKALVVDRHTNRAILGDSQGAVIALSLPDLSVVHRLAQGHDGSIISIALSPDERLLASSGTDRRVVLRDSMSFEVLFTFPAWTGVVRDLAFDASGRWLAFASSDSDVDLWDLKIVHDELASLELAWDQPAPEVASDAHGTHVGERSKPQVRVIRPGNANPMNRTQ
jgi:WD40 repeat protein